MQDSNVHAILESDPKVASVRDSLNDALALLDDVNENLATFDTKLHVMREDIAAIEVSTSQIPWLYGISKINLLEKMRLRGCLMGSLECLQPIVKT